VFRGWSVECADTCKAWDFWNMITDGFIAFSSRPTMKGSIWWISWTWKNHLTWQDLQYWQVRAFSWRHFSARTYSVQSIVTVLSGTLSRHWLKYTLSCSSRSTIRTHQSISGVWKNLTSRLHSITTLTRKLPRFGTLCLRFELTKPVIERLTIFCRQSREMSTFRRKK